MQLGVLAALAFATTESNAQLTCSYDELRNKALSENTQFVIDEAEKEAFIKKYIAEHKGKKDDEVYVFPVVFHIVHQYGPENITDAQILNQMEILNRDFRALNDDTSKVVDDFKALIGDSHIEFRLATIDPQGNCTNGIERLVSAETYIGSDGARYNAWDKTKYLNVWVCNVLPGAAGYVTGLDVAMAHTYTGAIGTSGEYGSRAMTHEIGHWLNLPHIWGLTSPVTVCGDEGVEDTPITKGFSPGSVSCTEEQSVCNPPIVENHQNYMDYAYCQMMFTKGQVDRMRALSNNTQAPQSKMWKPANRAATGIDGITDKHCKPVAAFYASKDIVCINVPVTYRDNSTVGFVESRSWTFQDATPATSTDISPIVRFNSAGWKTVTLTVTNADGSDTKTNTKSIFVSNASVAQSVPYFETFTDASVLGDLWLVKNPEENQTFFAQSTTAGYSDKQSLRLNGFNSPGGKTLKDGNGDVDVVYTPAFNLAGKNGWVISFKIAAASKTSNANNITEKLKFEYSGNCGSSWITQQDFTKAQLITSGYYAVSYTPPNQSSWKEVIIPITNAHAKDNMRFKFTYTSSSFSNNFYLDDFKIAPASGIDQIAAIQANVQVFPNPITEQSVLSYMVTNSSEVQLSITDVAGKSLLSTDLGTQGPGEQSIALNQYTSNFTAGIYMVTITIGNTAVTKKLIINQ